MENLLFEEIFNFIKDCDNDFLHGKFNLSSMEKAKYYLSIIQNKHNNSEYYNAVFERLTFIKNQIDSIVNRKATNETLFNLLPLNIADYIISLVKIRKLTDTILISRFVYKELSSVLYYNVTYALTTDEKLKKEIWNAKIDENREKIFSYVICPQWYQLYSYILSKFGIFVKKMTTPNRKGHVWGEIELNNNQIIIVDATEYIESSIDLSNAKSLSPTVGFAVLPKEFSGANLFNIFRYGKNDAQVISIKKYYELNRQLDIELNYIKNGKYPAEYIIENNEIFSYPEQYIHNRERLEFLFNKTIDFFRNLMIPSNIDGYEIYAYYSLFLKKLPLNIQSNISQKTIYVDTFEYKHNNRKNNQFLNAPKQYKEYLYNILCSTYYSYLSDIDKEQLFQKGLYNIIGSENIAQQIYDLEIKLAEINRRMNTHYAINQLIFYNPFEGDISSVQLYEPLMNKRNFQNISDYDDFISTLCIKRK